MRNLILIVALFVGLARGAESDDEAVGEETRIVSHGLKGHDGLGFGDFGVGGYGHGWGYTPGYAFRAGSAKPHHQGHGGGYGKGDHGHAHGEGYGRGHGYGHGVSHGHGHGVTHGNGHRYGHGVGHGLGHGHNLLGHGGLGHNLLNGHGYGVGHAGLKHDLKHGHGKNYDNYPRSYSYFYRDYNSYGHKSPKNEAGHTSNSFY